MKSKLLLIALIPIIVAAIVLIKIGMTPTETKAPDKQEESTAASNTYTSARWNEVKYYNFILSHPEDFNVEVGEGLGGGYLDESIVKAGFPDTFKDKKTNYVEAYALVSKSNKLVETACLAFLDLPNPASPDTQQKVINGITFKTQATVGAAAGNRYDSKLYRTFHNRECYEIALVVHTGNIQNYPEGTVQEFDKQKAFPILEQILATLRFKD